MNVLPRFILRFFALFLVFASAEAYVDPGSASMAVQFIIGGIVAAAFMLKTYCYRIKGWVRELFGGEVSPGAIDLEVRESDNPGDSIPTEK